MAVGGILVNQTFNLLLNLNNMLFDQIYLLIVHLFSQRRAHNFALQGFEGIQVSNFLLAELLTRGQEGLDLLQNIFTGLP